MDFITGRSPSRLQGNDDLPENREAAFLWQGAEWVNLDRIADLGMSRCSREHIHLVDISSLDRKEVAMSNMEKSAEILVTANATVAREGARLFNANSGIADPRGFGGYVPFRFVVSVADLRTQDTAYSMDRNPQWVSQRGADRSSNESKTMSWVANRR